VGSLIAGLALHVAIGVALAVVTWSIGLGVQLLVARSRDVRGTHAVFAYPIGLLALVLAAFAVLVDAWLAVPVALLAIAPLAALVRARGRLAPLARACAEPFLYALAGIAGLPVALGLLLHGPTATLDSNAYGDMLFYAAKLVSAADSVLPFRDLTVEGEPSAYVEAGSSFLGGALAWIPGLDPVLFQTTALPAFALAALAIGIGVLPRPAGPGQRFLPVAGLLAAALVAYPTWITDSPPVALTLPLACSLYVMATERIPLATLVAVSLVIALDLFLTKGFAAAMFVFVFCWAFVRDHARGIDRRVLLLGAGAVVAIGIALLAFFLATSGWLTERLALSFRPDDSIRGLLDQLDERDTSRAGLGFELFGLLALLAALVRMRAWPFVGFVLVGLAGHELVGGHGFDILVGLSILPAALLWRARPELPARHRALALTAAVLLVLSAWFRDTSALRAGLVFVVLLALATIGAFAGRRVLAYYPAAAVAILLGLSGRPFVAFVLLVALVLTAELAPAANRVVAPAGVAAAALIAAVSSLHLTTNPPTLTSDDYRLWREVEQVVPRDGLVFTSLTGPVISGEQGWNYYPGVANRQIWLAGWSNSFLLVDEEERARRLRLNAEVVRGGRDPEDVRLERHYGSTFGVLRAAERAPGGWRLLYRNDDLALYRIPR
jgi:hypothetical protein